MKAACILLFCRTLGALDLTTDAQSLSIPSRLRFENIGVAKHEEPELQAALTRAAGIYLDPVKPRVSNDDGSGISRRRTVLVTSFNAGYAPMFANWFCSAERFGLKFLVWPQEEGALRSVGSYIGSDDSTSRFQRATIFRSKAIEEILRVGGQHYDFRQGQYNVITNLKLIIVNVILRAGYNVWFSDTDIAYLRDPWPSMVAFRHGLACDYQFQTISEAGIVKSGYQGNTGFHLFRTSDASKRTVQLALERFSNMTRDCTDLTRRRCRQADDQTLLWEVISADYNVNGSVSLLRNNETYWTAHSHPATVRPQGAPVGLGLCPLPASLYAVGRVPLSNDTVIFHANYVNGYERKKSLLASKGLWDVQDRGRQCIA